MFDDLRRELDRLSRGVSISVTLPLDRDGYFDRRCSWEECSFDFKVLFEDWKSKVPDDSAVCPRCGHHAARETYNTPEQDTYIQSVSLGEVQERIDRGLRASADSYNRRQPRQGLISMRLRAGDVPRIIPVPLAAERAMTLRISCETCGCRFAVIGAAYFCPACGDSSAEHVYSQSLTAIRATIAALPGIEATLNDRDLASQVRQRLLEGSLEDLVTAFQRFAEVVYPRLPSAVEAPRRNVFQRLDAGSKLWKTAGGRAYEDILSSKEMIALHRFFQQRHLLAHQDGIVDQDYVSRSSDTTYAVGQRLVVREDAVLDLADILEKLASGMRQNLA